MSQPDIVLYHHPGACSQVAVYALERAGAPYRVELINLAKAEQTRPEYLAIHPLGKVPLLKIDGRVMIDNIAILTLIGTLYPDAGIFPVDGSPWLRAETVGGMSFVSGTMHPQVRGMMNPQRMTTGDLVGVREMAKTLFAKSLKHAEHQLEERGWWLGEQSIVDTYLHWALSVAQAAGYDLSPYPHLSALRARLMADPAFARMQAQEDEFKARLGL